MHKLKMAGFVFGVFAAVILIQATVAFANDSTARFGAGGIELIKSRDIRILEEVLEISTKKIRVRYRFLNESDKDINTTVAFPLPRYDPLLEYSSPTGRRRTIMATFRVTVSDRGVAHQYVRKAVVNDRDITDQLRKLGLSEEEMLFDFPSGQDNSARLEKLDALRAEIGHWKIEETAFWQQTFPAKKEIVVEHTYRPWVGESYSPPYQKGFSFDGYTVGTDEACVDDVTSRAIENRIKACVAQDPEMVYVFLSDVQYILATGRNWKGPIGKFTLRIDKETPDTFVSLCFPGKPKKVSPTVYEFYQKDFVPPDKLVVYFYTVHPQ